MKDSFKFHTKLGIHIYTAVKLGDGTYLVSWEDSDIADSGSRTYERDNIKKYIDGGTWVVIEEAEALFSQDLATEKEGWSQHKDGVFTVNVNENSQFAGVGISTDQPKESLTEKYGTLGIARPILETRKVGKDQMHMVNDGFPLALRHLAQIMTWAAEVKQYKLHDWRNLPNADVEFPSAEYRHANDNSIQKAEGLSALERVDHESGKLHIGHKVFNALCELELVLNGKIK